MKKNFSSAERHCLASTRRGTSVTLLRHDGCSAASPGHSGKDRATTALLHSWPRLRRSSLCVS